MATMNANPTPQASPFRSTLFGRFLHLPPGLAEQADGFFYAVAIQLAVGAASRQLAPITTVLAILMLSILITFVIGYRSFEARTRAQRILLRASAMLLLIEIVVVILHISRIKQGAFK